MRRWILLFLSAISVNIEETCVTCFVEWTKSNIEQSSGYGKKTNADMQMENKIVMIENHHSGDIDIGNGTMEATQSGKWKVQRLWLH